MPTRVVNKYREPFDVDITRSGQWWGNPFKIGRDGTREEVIAKFRAWLPKQPWRMAHLEELRGARLGCVCKPKPCHGDVYVEFLGKVPDGD